ncbi:hypothetical protein GGP50_002667 [Salinibacter ruber]|nr:hypothetical protein [Salinibacter ruber]
MTLVFINFRVYKIIFQLFSFLIYLCPFEKSWKLA